ncbi:MAG: oxidoreductase [Deltaproteobacteria bacterium]|nr:MAG: oxidoreductase [Deltaproteobacteria bacterium]
MINVTCVGFGGQGVLTMGLLLANVLMLAGKKLTWVPSYGSEMRGGTAACHLRIGDTPITNPFFKKIDVLIGMNDQSIDSYQKNVVRDGFLIRNTSMSQDITLREDIHIIEIDANRIATELDNIRGTNIVILGAAIAATRLTDVETFAEGIDNYFGKKGIKNPANRACFLQGASCIRG